MLRKSLAFVAVLAMASIAYLSAPVETEAIAATHQIFEIHKAVPPQMTTKPMLIAEEVAIVTTDIETGKKRCTTVVLHRRLDSYVKPAAYHPRC